MSNITLRESAFASPWSASLPKEKVPKVEEWSEPCEAWFEQLVREDPDRLLGLLEQRALEPHLLTFAAEYSGDISPAFYYHRLVGALTDLLRHPYAPVREGALYGIAKLVPKLPHLRTRLERHTREEHEPSPGVRRAAKGILGVID